jgi:Protein of unknown function (DUF1059)
MARYCVDCREFPSESNCDVTICASEQHLIDAAVIHATTAHGEKDTPELREATRKMMKPEGVSSAA